MFTKPVGTQGLFDIRLLARFIIQPFDTLKPLVHNNFWHIEKPLQIKDFRSCGYRVDIRVMQTTQTHSDQCPNCMFSKPRNVRPPV